MAVSPPFGIRKEGGEIARGYDAPKTTRCRRVTPTNEFEPFDLEEINQSIPSRFEQQVARHPQRLAVLGRDRSFTYAALNEAANRIADAVLDRYGEGDGQVAVLLEQGAWIIAAIMGILKAGKVYVPLDPRFPPSRLKYILEDSQSSLLLTDPRNISAASELAWGKLPVIDIEALGSGLSGANPAITISPHQGLNIIYTSGSTGNPKGVFQNHLNLLFEVYRVTNSFHVCREDRLALLHPCSSSASLRRIFPALMNGASVYPLDLREEGRQNLPGWFMREEITISNGRRLLRDCGHSLTGEDQFPRLRLVTFGGEPVYRSDVELYRRYLSPECLMLVNLAATETGSDRQFFIDKRTRITDPLVPVGYATEGTEISLRGEDGQEVGCGEVGEIAIRSRYLALGYWRQPELTRQRFLPDPRGGEERIYLSGDMGRMRADGCLFYLGRKDFQVKIRGHRIEPIEVETALLNLGGFSEAVVLALRTRAADESDEKRLVAYLVPDRLPAPSASDLRRSLSGTLPEHMIPSVFVMLEKFPRAPSGKVDHGALAAHFTANRPWHRRPTLDRPYIAPRNPIEEALSRIWAEMLHIDTVGVEDTFLDLGGDSLIAARILTKILEKFGINMPHRVLFDAPTVAQLATALATREPQRDMLERLAAIPEGQGDRGQGDPRQSPAGGK